MKKTKCAVIGVGNMGKHHARNYSEIENCQLVAVSDNNSKNGSAIAQKYNCRYYQNYSEMLKNEDFEIVTVATPTNTHFRIAYDCIKAGKNVLIEKPICSSTLEAIKLIRLAQKSKVNFSVGHIERFNPAIIKLKKILEKGKLGKIKSIIFRRIGPPPVQKINTNVILDIGVHDIDLANFLLNESPKKMDIFGGKVLNSIYEDFADIYFFYSQASVHIQINWLTPIKIRELMINCTKGYAEIDLIKQRLIFYPLDDISDDKILSRTSAGIKERISVRKKEPLKEEIKSFVKSVRNRQKPIVTAEQGLNALKIALQLSKIIDK